MNPISSAEAVGSYSLNKPNPFNNTIKSRTKRIGSDIAIGTSNGLGANFLRSSLQENIQNQLAWQKLNFLKDPSNIFEYARKRSFLLANTSSGIGSIAKNPLGGTAEGYLSYYVLDSLDLRGGKAVNLRMKEAAQGRVLATEALPLNLTKHFEKVPYRFGLFPNGNDEFYKAVSKTSLPFEEVSAWHHSALEQWRNDSKLVGNVRTGIVGLEEPKSVLQYADDLAKEVKRAKIRLNLQLAYNKVVSGSFTVLGGGLSLADVYNSVAADRAAGHTGLLPGRETMRAYGRFAGGLLGGAAASIYMSRSKPLGMWRSYGGLALGGMGGAMLGDVVFGAAYDVSQAVGHVAKPTANAVISKNL